MNELARPLPKGTEIDYRGEPATVIEDDGGSTIIVEWYGIKQTWFWEFDGHECSIVQPQES